MSNFDQHRNNPLTEGDIVVQSYEDDLISLTAFDFKGALKLGRGVISDETSTSFPPGRQRDRQGPLFHPAASVLCLACCRVTKQGSDSVMQVFGWLDITVYVCEQKWLRVLKARALSHSVVEMSLLVGVCVSV